MKSAYEIAMGRLEAQAPSIQLTEEQKDRIARVESKCKADIASRELLLQGEMEKARSAGDADQVAQLQRQFADEVRRLEEKREKEKDGVRTESKP